MEDSIRKLASVQRIKSLSPIKGADRIEVAEILGWKVVVKKGEFQVNDRCIYFEVDSVLPRTAWSEFLVDQNRPDKPIRLKTIRLRKQISQGLAIPASIAFDELGQDTMPFDWEGEDVTEILGVKKYEIPLPSELQGLVRGTFPLWLKKTDSHRVQSHPRVIEEMQGRECYVTIKIDGTSSTFYNRTDQALEEFAPLLDDFGVCSRNMDLKENDTNTYWRMAYKYRLAEKMQGMDIAIQAETYGQGIQKNKLGIDDVRLGVFDAFNILDYRYLDYLDLIKFCKELDIPMVDVVYSGIFKWKSVDELIEFASAQRYPNGAIAEGIVIRPMVEAYSEALQGRMAFKVISPKFLLKNND